MAAADFVTCRSTFLAAFSASVPEEKNQGKTLFQALPDGQFFAGSSGVVCRLYSSYYPLPRIS
jgi:hypothetical protein